MLGNFQYCNPTKLYFGPDALEGLHQELPKYGKRVLLVYGGGSIRKTGLYDQILALLHQHQKEVVEDAGVMPNPTIEKLLEGIERAHQGQIDFILAVGGGSVIDYAKALSVSIHCQKDPWETYFVRFEEPQCPIVPMGCVLTMVGTGSEMNGGSVITNPEQKRKVGHVFQEDVFPKFAILNPKLTFTVPPYQMVAGFFDIMSHILEQYFSDHDDCTSDYLMEGLMRSLIHSSRVAIKNPYDYEARSNIMWIATWALNTLVAKGKSTDWMVHMIGQSVGAHTDATHGMTLSAVSLAYYRHIYSYGLPQFKKFAIHVWDVDPTNRKDEEIALLGLEALEQWMKEMGLVLHLSALNVDEKMLPSIADHTFIMTSGYKVLTQEEILAILKESL